MEYLLKNGTCVNIRKAVEDDAEQLISLIVAVDMETKFLARNPGEFRVTVEEEKYIIRNATRAWFVAEIDDCIVGQCSIGRDSRWERFRHRASVAFGILKDYCDMGIGGKLMQECLKWCAENGITQLELDVVATNERAIRMYRNFGFQITGTIPKALKYPDGTYVDEYFMVKEL